MITKTCVASGKQFVITNDDIEYYQKMGVPEPTLCPEERDRRRQAWVNHRNLYKGKCSLTGSSIISAYHPESPFPIMKTDIWWSDKWDQYKTGRDFDFNRPFFDQFHDLNFHSPRPNLLNTPHYDENSTYTNHAAFNKNCYLIFDSDKNRDCLYSGSINSCVDVIDSYRCGGCELCYECVDCTDCYEGVFLQNCKHCHNSAFLKNCIGCKNCFGCVNLRNSEYCFMNEPLGKEAYEAKIKTLGLDRYNALINLRKNFTEFTKKFPHRFMEGVQNEDVLGDYLVNCKNAQYCFDGRNLRDCKYVNLGFDTANDCMDCLEVGVDAELVYEGAVCGFNAHDIRFSAICMDQISNLDYCLWCWQSKDLFGCIGLRKAKNCILNKQYGVEEYERLRDKIVAHMKETGEWGEFFPAHLSPFAYNESLAHESYPLDSQECSQKRFSWRVESEGSMYRGPVYDIPDDIAGVKDEILDRILTCDVRDKHYRLVRAELDFYRRMKLPIPRVCPEERHYNRLSLRNPRTLYDRNCAECSCAMQTTYSPERPEIILCEVCYQKAVQ